jgi:hypothetical protein
MSFSKLFLTEHRYLPPRETECAVAGLPDGLFSYQKYQFGYILEGLEIENVCIFYFHFEYFTATRYILWHFGIVCSNFVYFYHFGMFGPRKIWQHWSVVSGALKPVSESSLIFNPIWIHFPDFFEA